MKPSTFMKFLKQQLLIASAVALFAGAAAQAQWATNIYTVVLPHADDVGFNDVTTNIWDGVDFQVPAPNGAGNNIWGYFGSFFSSPPYITDWRANVHRRYEYTTFSAPAGARRPVLMGVLNENQDGVIDSAVGGEILLNLKALSLENVDVDSGRVQIRFEGGDQFQWNMSNARHKPRFPSYTPRFNSATPLTLRSVAGTSEIVNWAGQSSSPTKISVDPGTTLVFERVGSIGNIGSGNVIASEQLFFDRPQQNTADVNGGTLRLAYSGVVMDSAPTAAIAGGEVTAGFVVRNGGTLELVGNDTSLAVTMLFMRGGMLFDGGALALAERTGIIVDRPTGTDGNVRLKNATVTMGQASGFNIKAGVNFEGTSTWTTTYGTAGNFEDGLAAGFFELEDENTVVNFKGSGTYRSKELIWLGSGTLNIQDTATVFSQGLLAGPSAPVQVGSGKVNISSGGFLVIDGGGTGFAQFQQAGLTGAEDRINLVNHGVLRIDGGNGASMLAGGKIAEADGVVQVTADCILDCTDQRPEWGGQGGVIVEGILDLFAASRLELMVEPSANYASTLTVGRMLIDQSAPGIEPLLTFDLYRDAVRPLGQKFVLVDYNTLTSETFRLPRFRGLPDGHIFPLGLNHYQIRYSDAEYGAAHGGNDSVITLTVVPDYLAAGPDDLDRPTTTRVVKVLDATLLGNDTDPENDPLTIVGVANPQPAGATVTLSGNFVVYTAPAANAGNGSFEYTVSDGAGGHTATGQVTVHEVAPTGSGPNAARVVKEGDDYRLTFIGVPGRNYRVEHTASAGAPYAWNGFSPPVILTASPSGVFTFTDVRPPDPVRLYRAVLSP